MDPGGTVNLEFTLTHASDAPGNACAGDHAVFNAVVTGYKQCGAPDSVTILGTSRIEPTGELDVISNKIAVQGNFGIDANGRFNATSGPPCPVCP